MPNHVANDLTVKGPKADLTKFVAGIKTPEKGSKSILDSYLPVPADLMVTVTIPPSANEKSKAVSNRKKYGSTNWYDWCLKNYGTKWGDYDLEITERSNSVFCNFNSAWSPPIEGLQTVSKQFPTLSFSLKFFEGAMGFQGHYIFKNGKIVSKVDAKYSGRRGG